MPSLTVKAFAEMLGMPAYEQVRILKEQKYPREEPQSFKLPYYQTALNGIRSYYKAGNSAAELTLAVGRARALNPDHKRRHNIRVLSQFQSGPQIRRTFTIAPPNKHAAEPLPGVELRLTYDLHGTEAGAARRIFYNCREVAIDPEVAKTTLELSHWILEQNRVPFDAASLEYVDLVSGATHKIRKVRSRTIDHMEKNARVIEALWPTI